MTLSVKTAPKKENKVGVTKTKRKKSVESILPKFFTKEIISLRLWPYVKKGQFGFLVYNLLVFSEPKRENSAGDFLMWY